MPSPHVTNTTSNTSPSTNASATRGLATVALLKVNFDAGRDHIGMFEPFVLDAVSALPQSDFSIEDLQGGILARSQLSMPANTLRTLMGRLVGKGFATRDGGRYFRTAKAIPTDDLLRSRHEVEERQRHLATELASFARTQGLDLATPEDALASILDLMAEHHVCLALSEPIQSVSRSSECVDPKPTRRHAVVAAYLQDQVQSNGPELAIIQEMLEGFVLQNALLLKDISTATRSFSNLAVYLDTGIILGALGLRGESTELAIKEALSLLREVGADLSAFDITVQEVRNILSVYEFKLATPEGRLDLHPTDVTRHLLTNRYSPSDVATKSALVQHDLAHLGVTIRRPPRHIVEYTLDEADLAERLADRPGGQVDPRVAHDVACVAAVLTLRRGITYDSLDNARAVFATTSGLLVHNSTVWFENQGGHGVAPIVHHLALSNLAWLKRPAAGCKLKTHELVALCGVAIRPSRQAWQAFLTYLRSLRESGELSCDEVTAIVVSRLADRALAEETIDDDVDAATLSEVVERVKASYSCAADARVQAAETAARAKLEQAESVLASLQREAAERVSAEQERAASAEEARRLAEDNALRYRAAIEDRARILGQAISWLPAVALALVFVAATHASVDALRTGTGPEGQDRILVAALTVAGLLSLLWGGNLRGWRDSLSRFVAHMLVRWIAGPPQNPPGA